MRKNRFFSHFPCIFVMAAMLLAQPVHAQTASAAAAIFGPPKKGDATPPAPEIPKDTLGRDTPRGTLSGFISALSKSDYVQAANFLDLSYLSKSQAEAQGPDLAKGLQTLMDNGSWITPASMVSNDILGNKDDGLSEELEKLGTLRADGETTDLIAQKISNDDGSAIWLISSDTMKKVPTLVRHLSESWIDRVLPDQLLEPKLGGVPVGHWVAMLGLIGLAYILSWAIIKFLAALTRKCWKSTDPSQKKHVIDAFELPVRLYVATWFFVISANTLGISVVARQYFSHLTIIVAWVSLALLMWKLIDVIAATSQKNLIQRGKYGALSGVQFFRRTAKFIFLAVALFVTLDTLGIDVTTIVAALGIGGLALAFGAQKTVENFIGSIMVIFDQPVRIGDFCKVGDLQGTIEDIGMRSTRIRTLNRTVITIPNGDFSSQRIENFNHRDQFRFHTLIPLKLDTTSDQVRFLLVEIRSLLYSHPRIDSKSANVRMIGWTDSAYQLELVSYVVTRNNDDFMEVREDLLLRIMDIVAKSGTAFTLSIPIPPGSTFAGADEAAKNKAEAEQKVRDMAANNSLPLPKFDQAKIDSLKNSIEYPPKGSASYKGKKE